MAKKTVLLASIVLSGLVCLFSVSSEEIQTAQLAFEITSVEYSINGRTREWALEDVLSLKPGLQFETREALASYLADQEQILLNQRVLQTATVGYSVSDEIQDRPVQVAVYVEVKDTWNIIVLPYIKYDSNTGLLVSLRGRDYNFFGTLQELEINLDYERTEDNEDVATLSGDFAVPVQLFGQRWILSLDQAIEWFAEDWESRTSLGLGYQFGWLGQTWTTTYTQGYRVFTDDPEGDGYFLTSRVDLAASFGLTQSLPLFGTATYDPATYVRRNYKPGGISDARFGSVVGFEHSLCAGGFDWIGNFRRGVTAIVTNGNDYVAEELDWSSSIDGQVAWYNFWKFLGFSGRLSGFYLFDGAPNDQDDAAADARGVLNDTMQGNLGLFANGDVVLKTWTLRPLFEMQTGMFFDTALVIDTLDTVTPAGESHRFKPERDLRFGSGIEVVGFPLFARSLYMRGSIGFDLKKVAEGRAPLDSDVREIFIGLGHHY